MQRVQRKAWELLAKAEKKGDNRGAIVALREVRECVESLGEMLSRAADWRRPESFRVVVTHIGTVVDGNGKPTERKELPRMSPIPADQQPCIEVVPIVPQSLPATTEVVPTAEQTASQPASDVAPVPAGVTLRNGKPGPWSDGQTLRASPLTIEDSIPNRIKNAFSPEGRIGMSFGRRGRRW